MLLFPAIAWAQSEGAAAVADSAGLASTDLYTIIGTIINVFFGFLGIILLVIFLYAGYLWMTAGGNEAQIEKAKSFMRNGVIGLVIILSAYAITSFITGALNSAGIFGGGGTGTGGGGIGVERLSGALGSGAIRDHYPERGQTDVARNTRIFVTFKEPMDAASFGNAQNQLNTANIKIYATAAGEENALAATDVSVGHTDDLKTFTFDPPVLGSATADTNYTVFLSGALRNAAGRTVLPQTGYKWTFTVSTELDLTPPTVRSVIPVGGRTYDRNIGVEITFSEAVDPTSASGIRTATGFDNITVSKGGAITAGEYQLSNGYRTVTFISSEACGTNSCGETIYCLPANSSIAATVRAAVPGATPPQADFPYNGVVDVTGNALDGNGDGTAGDNYEWAFSTTGDINLEAPKIESIMPDISAEEVPLDQPVTITFNTVMLTASLSSESIAVTSSPSHELWYLVRAEDLNAAGEVVSGSLVPEKTRATIKHGVFLESTDAQTYNYGVMVLEGVQNEYQNCYSPGEGPGVSGGSCGTSASSPFCCNGVPSANACQLTP